MPFSARLQWINEDTVSLQVDNISSRYCWGTVWPWRWWFLLHIQPSLVRIWDSTASKNRSQQNLRVLRHYKVVQCLIVLIFFSGSKEISFVTTRFGAEYFVVRRLYVSTAMIPATAKHRNASGLTTSDLRTRASSTRSSQSSLHSNILSVFEWDQVYPIGALASTNLTLGQQSILADDRSPIDPSRRWVTTLYREPTKNQGTNWNYLMTSLYSGAWKRFGNVVFRS